MKELAVSVASETTYETEDLITRYGLVGLKRQVTLPPLPDHPDTTKAKARIEVLERELKEVKRMRDLAVEDAFNASNDRDRLAAIIKEAQEQEPYADEMFEAKAAGFETAQGLFAAYLALEKECQMWQVQLSGERKEFDTKKTALEKKLAEQQIQTMIAIDHLQMYSFDDAADLRKITSSEELTKHAAAARQQGFEEGHEQKYQQGFNDGFSQACNASYAKGKKAGRDEAQRFR